MDKVFIKTFLVAALQCFNSTSFAGAMGTTDNLFNVFIPNLKPGFDLSLSALILQPQAGNLGWGAVTTVLPIPTPQWQIKSFDPDYRAGFQAGARYIFANSGTDLQLNWFSLSTNYKDAVNVNPVSQWISPFSQTGTPPTGGEITGVASLNSAKAKLTFNYNAVNLDVGKFVNLGSNLQTRFFTGLSSTRIKEKLVSNFYGGSKVNFSLNNTSTYIGVGPRLGLANDYYIHQGIHFIGQFASSLLIGNMQPAQYKFKAISSDLALVGIAVNSEQLSSSSVTQLVPELDAKIGLSYSHILQKGHELSVELGYMGAVYFNPLSAYETNTNVIALDSGSLSTSSVKHVQSNFSVAGPYLSLHFKC
ncbi:major outer membrane protein [Legionella quinlivanii]|uniref:Major outer membrane protein n=1 Tax=Legionella quinlivanii TaxID=45073 RepID=A0A0W0Y0F3_9GAMM|nr:Lpg1974 family pore-forming outer membrane protein [Legionella quinlivanii]KTD50175.1 major outer membrane protein [Legionella quinlivanii]MCW8450080.1 Lpg1974 family pore-forming outer membrane protein [Legionella quinlivanii]SEF48654.1 Legionella pneumophila major outer membrane protein precursor [Legionella quinlivanii DSM 21216]STY11773.1 major outer membrane protein [Legionella quinlivanii]